MTFVLEISQEVHKQSLILPSLCQDRPTSKFHSSNLWSFQVYVRERPKSSGQKLGSRFDIWTLAHVADGLSCFSKNNWIEVEIGCSWLCRTLGIRTAHNPGDRKSYEAMICTEPRDHVDGEQLHCYRTVKESHDHYLTDGRRRKLGISERIFEEGPKIRHSPHHHTVDKRGPLLSTVWWWFGECMNFIELRKFDLMDRCPHDSQIELHTFDTPRGTRPVCVLGNFKQLTLRPVERDPEREIVTSPVA